MRTHLGIGATIFVEDIICEGIKEVGVGILTCSLNNGTAIGELYRWHPRAMLRLLVVSTVVKANHHELPRGARDQSHHVLLIGIESDFAQVIKNSGVAAEASGYIA